MIGQPCASHYDGFIHWVVFEMLEVVFQLPRQVIITMIEKNWLDLKKPDEMEIKVSEYNQSQAVVAVGPFERGFGVTIGNALRRVLLSSLQGAAVTSVQIQGVVHEFSSIPGVREDVTDLVLNLKGVAVRMDTEGPKRLRYSSDGWLEILFPAIITQKLFFLKYH